MSIAESRRCGGPGPAALLALLITIASTPGRAADGPSPPMPPDPAMAQRVPIEAARIAGAIRSSLGGMPGGPLPPMQPGAGPVGAALQPLMPPPGDGSVEQPPLDPNRPQQDPRQQQQEQQRLEQQRREQQRLAEEAGDEESQNGPRPPRVGGGGMGGGLIDISRLGNGPAAIDRPMLSGANNSLWQGADGIDDGAVLPVAEPVQPAQADRLPTARRTARTSRRSGAGS